MDKNTEALLKKASTTPQGVKVEEFNPTDRIPSVAVGEEFTPGMTIEGWYDETLPISSPKFRYGEESEKPGEKMKRLHVLRIGSPTGERLGIWSVANLRIAFEQLQPGTFISITYKGRGQNAKGQQEHFFEYKRQIS
jgi:hypothetical protein